MSQRDDIAALDWAVELDRRSWLADRPEWVKQALRAGEVGAIAQRAAAVEPRDGAGEGAAPGLVQTPTSQTRCRPTVPVRVLAASQAIADAIGALTLDPQARRLSMLRMSVGVAARWHVADAPGRCLMVTLTYRDGGDWQAGHIRAYLDTVRHWYRRRGIPCRYVWVAELQKRGAIHYHVALWLPAGELLPKPDEAGWWTHGWSRIEWARGAVGYLMKYLSKGTDVHGFPKGARTYGAGGLGEVGRGIRRWCRYPAFVKARADVTQVWRRVVGGGWQSPDGTHWRSEFRRVWVGCRWMLERVCEHGSDGPATGPYSSLVGRYAWAS